MAERPNKDQNAQEREEERKLFIEDARSIITLLTPMNNNVMTHQFLALKVHESTALTEIVLIIIEKAIEQPNLSQVYARLCSNQVNEELKDKRSDCVSKVSDFNNEIRVRTQDEVKIHRSTMKRLIKQKQAVIGAETDEVKKKVIQESLIEEQIRFRNKSLAICKFIGHLFLECLLPVYVISSCTELLLKSVFGTDADCEDCKVDEDDLECAVVLLGVIGKKVHEKKIANAAAQTTGNKIAARMLPPPPFPMDMYINLLKKAAIVDKRLRNMIMDLVDQHSLGWVQKKEPDDFPEVDGMAENPQKEDEEVKKIFIEDASSIINLLTPLNENVLIHQFLSLKVYKSSALNEIVSIIFEKVIEQPNFCQIYARLCSKQANEELKQTEADASKFVNAVLLTAENEMTNRRNAMKLSIKEKQADVDSEIDEAKKKEKKRALVDEQINFRRRSLGTITLIGHLFLEEVSTTHIIFPCTVGMLKSVQEKPDNVDVYRVDEDDVECAVVLLGITGKKLHENNLARAVAQLNISKAVTSQQPQPRPQPQFPLDMTINTLKGALPIVNNRLRSMIARLIQLHVNGWAPKEVTDETLKKADQEKKKEEAASNDEDLLKEVFQLNNNIAEMKVAMEVMRKSITNMEERNKALLQLITNRKNK